TQGAPHPGARWCQPRQGRYFALQPVTPDPHTLSLHDALPISGSVGSITAPLASLNQLATSTAIVKFFVSLASVTGGSKLIAISRSEEHTSELQSRSDLACRLPLEKKKRRHRAPRRPRWARRRA